MVKLKRAGRRAPSPRDQFIQFTGVVSRVPVFFLTAVAMDAGAERSAAETEAEACLTRHGTEPPGIDSSLVMIREMRAWAAGASR